MLVIARRKMLRRLGVAAGATLAAGLVARKPRAAELSDLAEAIQPAKPPTAPPPIQFVDVNGKTHSLAEFKGHGLVVNLWATWCAPCVAELPSLAKLAQAVAPQDVAVLPLSSDHGGKAAVTAFMASHKIEGLPVLLDPEGAVLRAWHVRGIPTTLLINREGLAVARVEGSVDWATPAAVALVKKLVEG
ncbi:MAG: TlpA family protein disulfide reductase [Rhodospirillales bacterium]|nr:TlpA family protein disulfide reductase [Rhodospirillales bacterium]